MLPRKSKSFGVLLLAAVSLIGGYAKPSSEQSEPPLITLGKATVPLSGPWKFRIGDSPKDSATGKWLWAETDFDDLKWETLDLHPKNSMVNPVDGSSEFIPGWTSRGHAGYSGFAWYRIRVLLDVQSDEPLAVAGPDNVDDGYQVFIDGDLIGSFGEFGGRTPATGITQPMFFFVPPSANQSGQQLRTVAFRVWMHPATLTFSPEAGGFHSVPLIGGLAVIEAQNRIKWEEIRRGLAPATIDGVLFAILAVIAFSLILFDRSDQVYLWVAGVFLLRAIDYAWYEVYWRTHLSGLAYFLAANPISSLLYGGWAMVWWIWFGRKGGARVPRIVLALCVLQMTASTIALQQFYTVIPFRIASTCHLLDTVIRILLVAVLAWIAIQGIHEEGTEGWLVLAAVILQGITFFWRELSILSVSLSVSFFGIRVGIDQLSDLLFVLAVGLLLLRRLLLSQKRQRQIALDVRQAQEVQQVILPESQSSFPGFEIESEYRPAREVGGDFFQIIPCDDDGLLVVAGDVTGKGLKAGMLVALLVGAIRSTVEWSTEPLRILQALNQRLLGRQDAQATCLALRVGKDGSVRLANAGHLAPYLNGTPIAMEGALPLGIMGGAEFSVMDFKLVPNDRLILVSDGIIEATDASGDLFGFDRLHQLLGTAASAREVASAALRFGQEDDISVISLTRIGNAPDALQQNDSSEQLTSHPASNPA